MKRLFLPTLLLLLSLPSLALAVEFTPLTSIPAFQDIASSPNLSAVLNNIYRICIGIAAALAVLQLVRAGIMYMGGDSVTNKKEAKDLILMSLLGLLLVLSPVIVFSIINPDILSLRINTSSLAPSDAGALQNANMNGPAGGGTPPPQSPVQLENTCTVPANQATLQSNLTQARQNQPTGEIAMDIQPWGQAGIGCCNAVTDTNGSRCVGASTQSFTNAGTLLLNYSCKCNGGAPAVVANSGKWNAVQVSIRFDLRNTSAQPAFQNSTPFTMNVVVTSPTLYDTEAACESTSGFGQAQILSSFQSNAYVCTATPCALRVDWVKDQSNLPSGALSLVSRTCAQN